MLFAREGAKVILADIDGENTERTRANIQEDGGKGEIPEADMCLFAASPLAVIDNLTGE